MSAVNLGGDRLQGDGLRPLLEQELTRGGKCSRATFFGG